jgi:hypothetical protein
MEQSRFLYWLLRGMGILLIGLALSVFGFAIFRHVFVPAVLLQGGFTLFIGVCFLLGGFGRPLLCGVAGVLGLLCLFAVGIAKWLRGEDTLGQVFYPWIAPVVVSVLMIIVLRRRARGQRDMANKITGANHGQR